MGGEHPTPRQEDRESSCTSCLRRGKLWSTQARYLLVEVEDGEEQVKIG